MSAIDSARTDVTAAEQRLANLETERGVIADAIAGLETWAKVLQFAAVIQRQPAAVAQMASVEHDLEQARQAAGATANALQQADQALAAARAQLAMAEAADLAEERDMAECAAIRAWLARREAELEVVAQGLRWDAMRQKVREKAFELQRRGQPLVEINPAAIGDAVNEARFRTRLAQLESAMAEPGRYDPDRYGPMAPQPPAPAGNPVGRYVYTTEEWAEHMGDGTLPSLKRGLEHGKAPI